jgi:hypothetical protein
MTRYLGRLRDTRLPPSPCPYCGKVNDGALAADLDKPDASPSPGDITVCIECASPLIFTEALRLRKPWPGEVDVSEPTLRRAIFLVQQLDRRKG